MKFHFNYKMLHWKWNTPKIFTKDSRREKKGKGKGFKNKTKTKQNSTPVIIRKTKGRKREEEY